MRILYVFCLLFLIFTPDLRAESGSVSYQSSRSLEAGLRENPILIGEGRARNCRQVLSTCESCTNDRTLLAWKQTYQIVAAQCRQEQEQKGCNQLVQQEPALRSKMLDCSPQAVCERQDFVLNLEDTIKGCFWNAPKAFDMDIWNMIVSTPGAIGQAINDCYGSPQNLVSRFISTLKCQSPLYYIIKGSRGLSQVNFQRLYNLGKGWVQKQGVKMSCYSPEAQTEMICYGILNVIVPTKIGKLKDIPEVIRMSGLARRAEPVAANVARTSERDAVGTAERVRARASDTTPLRDATPTPQPRARTAARGSTPAASTLRAAATGEEVANATAHAENRGAHAAGSDVASTTERATADAATRTRFTDRFVNKTYTTERQNQAWVDLATSSETSAGTRFFDVENSAMKRLNDTTLDKNFVTALTNQHKEILARRMEELARRYPTVEFSPYSDFKSMRYALRPKPPATQLPAGLQQDLARTFTAANSEFVTSLERQHLIPRGENASSWFRSGFGENADEASLASRYARSAAGENQMHTFADTTLQQRLDDMRRLSESSRARLQQELASTSLMEPSGVPGKSIPRREVFDGVRKTQNNAQLIDFIKKTTGETITDTQATELRSYAGLVDEFSPGIHIVRREVASLADSRAGGFSIDFAGLGSFNGQATASALARSDSIQTAVRETRLGERGVTDLFLERKRQVQSSIEAVLRRHGITAEIVASGDDMVVKPSRTIPADVRQEITDELARQIDPSSIRMSHVGGDISSGSERMLMATIGEACEKMIRKLARAAIAPERLNQILILVEVSGTSSANFGGHVVLGSGQTTISSTERAAIQSAADQALHVRCR